MSQEQGASSIDLIRWTFTASAEHRAEIEGHLADLGLDVHVYEGTQFVVNWEEPDLDSDTDEVIAELWALNGEPFEVTQEEFHRVGLHTLHHVDDEAAQEAA